MSAKDAEQIDMLNVKFTKTDRAEFLSHIDMLNTLKRTIKRAGYEPAMSIGYNSRTIIKLSSPIPLGIKSYAEYFTIVLDVDDIEKFLDKSNENAPKGLKFLRGWATPKNPNFAANILASDYFIATPKAYNIREGIYNDIKDSFIVDISDKEIKKDVKELIYHFEITKEGIRARLAVGNPNLRADIVMQKLNEMYNLGLTPKDIIKEKAWYKTKEKGLIEVDAYMDSIKK